VAVGASLGPRGGVEELGWQRQRAEGQLHRGGGNGMRRGGARAGRGRAPFHMCGDVEGERGSRLEGRAQEFKARHATAEVHRVSPTGGAAGGGVPTRARAGGHARVLARPKGDLLGRSANTMMAPQAHSRPTGGPGRRGESAVRRLPRGATRRQAREPERPLPPFQFKQPLFQHEFLKK
jgi:hypothetical protein